MAVRNSRDEATDKDENPMPRRIDPKSSRAQSMDRNPDRCCCGVGKIISLFFFKLFSKKVFESHLGVYISATSDGNFQSKVGGLNNELEVSNSPALAFHFKAS